MKKVTLWEEIMGYEFDNEDDTELIEWLEQQSIKVNYDDRANDPFFVWLYRIFFNYTETIHGDPEYLIGKCQVLKDLTQADGETYPITFRLPNGYDLSCRIDDDDEVFITGGKKVTDSPSIEFIFGGGSRLTDWDALMELPTNAHLMTEYELYNGALSKDNDEWMYFYDTDDYEVAKACIEEEREELRRKYS